MYATVIIMFQIGLMITDTYNISSKIIVITQAEFMRSYKNDETIQLLFDNRIDIIRDLFLSFPNQV